MKKLFIESMKLWLKSSAVLLWFFSLPAATVFCVIGLIKANNNYLALTILLASICMAGSVFAVSRKSNSGTAFLDPNSQIPFGRRYMVSTNGEPLHEVSREQFERILNQAKLEGLNIHLYEKNYEEY